MNDPWAASIPDPPAWIDTEETDVTQSVSVRACSPARPAGRRRGWLRAAGATTVTAALVSMSLAWPGSGWAQEFPSRPIRIVVPYSTGTGSDALARAIATGIAEKTGKAVIVENREGGGSLIGTMAVAKAAPDGYTILMAANPMSILPSQSAKPPYDPVQDFVPVAKVGTIPLVLAVTSDLKIRTIKELISYSRANPGKLNYGSSGAGTISQQEMEFLKQAADLDVLEVPYKSTAQAMTDLISGTLSLFPVVIPLVAQHIQTGRAHAIAVIDANRSPLLPNVPAITEQFSAPGYVPTPVWYGFVAPAKTPPAIVQTLSTMINDVLETPEVKARMVAIGAQRTSVTNEQFAADIRSEYERAGALAKRLGTFK
jgi:tripartite-type tricarboxylate transporter receptor subunit TctC